MVPEHNSLGQLPQYTAFRSRNPSYKTDTPYAFETTGFLQRAQGPLFNTAAPRADFCLWLGTTRNLKGTHRCFNLGTLTEITGENFRPAPLSSMPAPRYIRTFLKIQSIRYLIQTVEGYTTKARLRPSRYNHSEYSCQLRP